MSAVVQALRNGGIAAVPTDTAYALAADATNRTAVAKVKKLKGRNLRKPILVIAGSIVQVKKFFVLTKPEARLANKFWPGPLTIVLKPKRALKQSGLSKSGIGVRVPASATARQIATLLECPITATSANRSGGATPYTASATVRQFKQKKPDALLDAGRLTRKPVSTVVRLRGKRLEVLRPGAISEQKLHGLR
jgi:L-threonylcarbamoyladenylate synthase